MVKAVGVGTLDVASATATTAFSGTRATLVMGRLGADLAST